MVHIYSLTSLLHISKRSSPSPSVPKSDAVSTAPDGRKSSGVLPRIYASKSMQNLENVSYKTWFINIFFQHIYFFK